MSAGHGRGIKVSTRTIDTISYGTVELDLSGVEQLAEKSQTRAIAFALQLIASQLSAKHGHKILQLLETIDANIDNQASSCLYIFCRLLRIMSVVADIAHLRCPGTGYSGTLAQVL